MIKATLVDHENNDLTVVNAARSSFRKQVSEIVLDGTPEASERKRKGMGSDDRLINFLARNDHWVPFAHPRFRFQVPNPFNYEPSLLLSYLGNEECRAGFILEKNTADESWEAEHSLYGWMTNPPPIGVYTLDWIQRRIQQSCPLSAEAFGYEQVTSGLEPEGLEQLPAKARTFSIDCPILVARQLMTSTVGIVYSEVSRRYVKSDPKFHWFAGGWRAAPSKDIKQGSGGELEKTASYICTGWEQAATSQARQSYNGLIGAGVAPEQARGVLPMQTMTRMWMTATDSALERVLSLRGPGGPAQSEIQELTQQIRKELENGRDQSD